MEVGATSEVNFVRILRLDDEHDQTRDHTELLRREMTATRAEVQELQERRATLEGHLAEAERQAAESRAEMGNFMSTLRVPQIFKHRK